MNWDVVFKRFICFGTVMCAGILLNPSAYTKAPDGLNLLGIVLISFALLFLAAALWETK